jgi:hypothetical protein
MAHGPGHLEQQQPAIPSPLISRHAHADAEHGRAGAATTPAGQPLRITTATRQHHRQTPDRTRKQHLPPATHETLIRHEHNPSLRGSAPVQPAQPPPAVRALRVSRPRVEMLVPRRMQVPARDRLLAEGLSAPARAEQRIVAEEMTRPVAASPSLSWGALMRFRGTVQALGAPLRSWAADARRRRKRWSGLVRELPAGRTNHRAIRARAPVWHRPLIKNGSWQSQRRRSV